MSGSPSRSASYALIGASILAASGGQALMKADSRRDGADVRFLCFRPPGRRRVARLARTPLLGSVAGRSTRVSTIGRVSARLALVVIVVFASLARANAWVHCAARGCSSRRVWAIGGASGMIAVSQLPSSSERWRSLCAGSCCSRPACALGPSVEPGGALAAALVAAVAKTPTVVAGLGIYGASALAWIVVLSRTELSFAYPFLSLAYVIVTVAAMVLLGERFTARQWAGLAAVVAGVLLVALSAG